MYSGTPAATAPGVVVVGMMASPGWRALVFRCVEERRRVRSRCWRLRERDVNVLAVEFVARKREGTGQADCAQQLDRVAAGFAHSSPLRRRSVMCSAARAASAMIVCVGFFSDADGNTLPSITYRFGTSCVRQSALTTDDSRIAAHPAATELVVGAQGHRAPRGSPRRRARASPGSNAPCR